MSDKYKNGKIYTIRCKNDDSLIYVGSTVQPLFKRWHQHKTRVNNQVYNNILYQKMRETNIENWYIELYEEFACKNKEQLNKREGEIIREIGKLNKQIAGRTKKEYVEDNKDKLLEQTKEYREKNKQIISEKMKEYREKNKQIISEKNKDYYEANKEKFKQKFKEYYLKKKNNN